MHSKIINDDLKIIEDNLANESKKYFLIANNKDKSERTVLIVDIRPNLEEELFIRKLVENEIPVLRIDPGRCQEVYCALPIENQVAKLRLAMDELLVVDNQEFIPITRIQKTKPKIFFSFDHQKCKFSVQDKMSLKIARKNYSLPRKLPK